MFKKNLYSILLAAFLAVSGTANAELVPPKGVTDSRVRVVPYNPDEVYQLKGYVGFDIHLQWAEGETFVTLGSGDTGSFDIGSERNHFFIKPKAVEVGTNLTVLTNMRVYYFEYSVSKLPEGPKNTRNMMWGIRFIYPQDEARRAASELERQRAEAQFTQATVSRPRNQDYWFCGKTSLKPLSAYDDGVHTRIKFPAKAEFPAIFVKNDDDSESLLNFNIENDEVVIHRVARRFVLRRGQLVGCVVNKAFEGGGERVGNNTVVPNVYRQTRGVGQ